VISGNRAEEKTPVTKTDLTRAEIENRYYGQDIPLLLRDTPSINAYAEAGNGGSGYSYITLRGISPTRINFTLDGVPLADSEDMGTYFSDFPDLAHSLASIQVQRGVGTSSVGSPSFGGALNFQAVALRQSPTTTPQIPFFAADRDPLETNLRANPLTPSDKDSFGYDLGQLQYIRANMTASVFYQRGYGWYDLDGFRYGLDGLLLGGMVTASKSYGP